MPILRNIAGALIGDIIGRRSGHGLMGAGIGIIAVRIAARSIPGAMLVGGAILAKKIYDQNKGRDTAD